MRLNEEGLKNRREWEEKGYQLPTYDREEMVKKTREAPLWVHFGAGNIFRAFHADIAEDLLQKGVLKRGITVVEGYDYEIIEKKYRPNDNYSISVVLKADGSVEKKVIGSIAESLLLDSENEPEFNRLKEIFRQDSLRLATFTITEKGYAVTDASGGTLPGIQQDLAAGPGGAKSYLGKVAALIYERYLAEKKPIALVSTDNCSHNGDKLYAALHCFAQGWEERGLVDGGFCAYVEDKEKVSFPWTMIDKITPRPDTSVENLLRKDRLEDVEPVVTGRNTYVSSFVNSEETGYLVVEDAFPNGRVELEKRGVIFTDRETVDKVERMKVCTCLNPLHTALAIFGCLLGYQKISDEMKDEDLVKLIQGIGYIEGLPVVTDPVVIHPKEFIDTVVKVRLPNPFMPDTPQRIATDTSQKLAIRFGETIKNLQREGKDPAKLTFIPFVFAGWIRYLCGVTDEGVAFACSPDPLMEELAPYGRELEEGKEAVEEKLHPLLSNAKIFGVNLYEVGLAERVLTDLNEMLKGRGSVRKALKKVTSQI